VRSLRSILLTGGAGFIGSALARHLLAEESLQRLVVLDKLTYAGDRRNLAGPDQDPRFTFVEGDIADSPLVAQLLEEHGVTGVFNLAAESHVDRSILDSREFIATNVAGTGALLDACRSGGVPLLHCSTDEVYGSVDPPAKSLETDPLNPSSPYAASKASADLLCLAAVTTYQQNLVITRCANNYGPRQHAEKLIPTIIRHALRDEPIPLYGNGMQIRDWIHVDDHCRGLLTAFRRGRAGMIYNLGGRCERTNLGLARSILGVLDKPESLIGSVPDRPGHDLRYSLDLTRAQGFLGWGPQMAMAKSLPTVVRALAADLPGR
jgi:dTDP-glucose 4,6-dehydratase